MGQQGALHAGTGTVFHAALVPSLDSYITIRKVKYVQAPKGGYIIAPDANSDLADEQLAKYPNNYRWTFDSNGVKRRRI